jgi:hypothetical protein
MSRACASSQRRRRCIKVHRGCGALRTMHIKQRTPHIVRRLVLGVQHATCCMCNVRHATRNTQHALSRQPRCGHKHICLRLTTCKPCKCATSWCNMDHPTGRTDWCHTTCNMQHAACNTKMQHGRTPCNIKHNVQQTPRTMQRTTHPMQPCDTHNGPQRGSAPPKRVRCCRP